MKIKKIPTILSAIAICAALSACSGTDDTSNAGEINIPKKKIVLETSPPDKYTYYLKDYVGRNCASLGSIWGKQVIDYSYGPGCIRLNLVSDDGSYIDISNESILKSYKVTGQSVEPNTEIKLVFKKDENGDESAFDVENQSIREIELYVTPVKSAEIAE